MKDSVQSLQSRRVLTRQPSLIKQHQENTGTRRASKCLCGHCRPAYTGNTDLPFPSHSIVSSLSLYLSVSLSRSWLVLLWFHVHSAGGFLLIACTFPSSSIKARSPFPFPFTVLPQDRERQKEIHTHTDRKRETDILSNNMRSVYKILVYALKYRFANTVQQADQL